MNRRLGKLHLSIVLVALVLLTCASVADACGRCGVACCPTYQVVQQTVYVPQMVPETQLVTCTEYKCEIRERPVTVQRCVPEIHQVKQKVTVMVPQVRMREVKCMVPVAVWDEVEQPYTVCVPYQVKRTGTRTVCKPVQVQEMRTVCRDEGHWEQMSCYQPAACGLFACCGCVPMVCCTQMVWVPNIVQEEVPVTVCKYEYSEEPFEYIETCYKQETQMRKVKVCRYEQREQVRQVPYTVCVPQERECVRNVCTYKMVTEERMQKYTVMVPQQVQKQVTVMKCQMVPKQVCYKVPVCGCCTSCCH
jgi:hypothetical protein